jgi:Calx-beta domain
VTVNDISVTEGAANTTTVARFTLTLSATARKPVNVRYSTITVNGDDLYEGDDTFTLHLINAKAATIADADGVATIVDDDPVPTISIENAAVLEGTAALSTTPLSFDVTLSGKSSQDVTVDYASADGSALQPADYGSVSGTLTWPAGTQGTQQVTVQVVADFVDEPDETFAVGLTNATGLSVLAAKDTADGIILDDDLPSPPPPGGKESSTTTLKVVKKRLKTLAIGSVTPARTGLKVTVTLYRRKSGHWRVVGSKHPLLGTAVDPDHDGIYSSPYKAIFSGSPDVRRSWSSSRATRTTSRARPRRSSSADVNERSAERSGSPGRSSVSAAGGLAGVVRRVAGPEDVPVVRVRLTVRGVLLREGGRATVADGREGLAAVALGRLLDLCGGPAGGDGADVVAVRPVAGERADRREVARAGLVEAIDRPAVDSLGLVFGRVAGVVGRLVARGGRVRRRRAGEDRGGRHAGDRGDEHDDEGNDQALHEGPRHVACVGVVSPSTSRSAKEEGAAASRPPLPCFHRGHFSWNTATCTTVSGVVAVMR